jgi:type I restriction-modification system DNA methylase subunit
MVFGEWMRYAAPMAALTLSALSDAYSAIASGHRAGNQSGFEIHDRRLFITHYLPLFGYAEGNVLEDVAQRTVSGPRTPDIRLFGRDEVRDRHAHSQFVIETKNFRLYGGDFEAVDLLQLKHYIISNRSRIRVIVATDYQTLFAFNASLIKSDSRFRPARAADLADSERRLFHQHLMFRVDFSKITETDLNNLRLLSHQVVFERQTFRDPHEMRAVADIADGEVRRSFIAHLFHSMRAAERQLSNAFEQAIAPVLRETTSFQGSGSSLAELLLQRFEGTDGQVVQAFVLWGIEMNYLPPFIREPQRLTETARVLAFLQNEEYRAAFVLASAYSLVNKSFFIRTLEDSATEQTRFLEGAVSGRYLSDGILQLRYNESPQSLVDYLRDLFSFRRPDLRRYDFLLRKDIFTWVLDRLDPQLLIEIVRVFNDVYFRNLNQDILGDIYEHYLEQDRPDGGKSYRQLLGQYYTPKPIVRLMWKLTREVLRKTRGHDLYDPHQALLRVLDPCYGSGTFLTEAVLQANAAALGKVIDRRGRVYGFIKDRSTSRQLEMCLTGFELNPLSKGIADVNLYFSLVQAYGLDALLFHPVRRLELYRTDSLELAGPDASPESSTNLSLFAPEVRQALTDNAAICSAKGTHYDIIIANPPYAGSDESDTHTDALIPFAVPAYNFDESGNERDFVANSVLRRGTVPQDEANRGKLRDLYSYFFGAADRLVSPGGIVTFITSNTWIGIPTYKFFRKYLLKNYTIHYVVNFNNISERNSLFAPDAGIATAIVVMTKEPPPDDHEVQYLDVSHLPLVRQKFESFAQVEWRGSGKDRRDILSFELKPLADLDFVSVRQSAFLLKPDYLLRVNKDEAIVAKVEEGSERISQLLPTFQGVDVGDLNFLVAPSRAALRENLEKKIFLGDLSGIGKTAAGYIRANLSSKKLDARYDESKEFPFAFQKDMERWAEPSLHWTYMDNQLLWRSRIGRQSERTGEIFRTRKLFVLERREQNRLVAAISSVACAPQHGGRFFYCIEGAGQDADSLHYACATINSKLYNFYYKVAAQGNKDIRIRPFSAVAEVPRRRLASISRELHELHRDLSRLRSGSISFESSFFQNHVLGAATQANLLDDNEHWVVESSGSSVDCYVERAWPDPDDACLIWLNDEARLRFRSRQVADRVLDLHLRGFEGNLYEKPVLVDVRSLGGDTAGPAPEALVESRIAALVAECDEIIERVHGLSADERLRVAETMK